MENIREVFEKYEDEYLKFDRVANKFSQRADLNAFMLLDNIFPSVRDIISCAEHDEIYLNISGDAIECSNITEEQVCDLVRCGVRCDENGLCMFV